jgi:hypothetical protein
MYISYYDNLGIRRYDHWYKLHNNNWISVPQLHVTGDWHNKTQVKIALFLRLTKKCTLESNVGLFCVLMCLYTCNIFVKCSYKIRFSCVWITKYTATCQIAIYQTVCENMPDPKVLCRLVDLISTRISMSPDPVTVVSR